MSYDLGLLGQQSTASAALILIGLLSVASVLYTVGRVLLSVFVLPGKPVCSREIMHASSLTIESAVVFIRSQRFICPHYRRE